MFQAIKWERLIFKYSRFSKPRTGIHFLKASNISFFGLSASAVEAYGLMLVRPCVRSCVTAYLENRTSDFDDFLHKATS